MPTYRFSWTIEAKDLRTAKRELDKGIDHVCYEDGNLPSECMTVYRLTPAQEQGAAYANIGSRVWHKGLSDKDFGKVVGMTKDAFPVLDKED